MTLGDVVRILWLAFRLRLGQRFLRWRVPWALRRWGMREAALPGQVDSYLYVLDEQAGMAARLEDVPPGGVVLVSQWFVGLATRLPEGGGTLASLTRFYHTAARAERERQRLIARHPSATTLGIVMQLNPADPAERSALIEIQRQALRDGV
jgi:hypothetical protein